MNTFIYPATLETKQFAAGSPVVLEDYLRPTFSMEKSEINPSLRAKEIESGVQDSDGSLQETFDAAQTKALVRKQDLRILPLCAGICESHRFEFALLDISNCC